MVALVLAVGTRDAPRRDGTEATGQGPAELLDLGLERSSRQL